MKPETPKITAPCPFCGATGNDLNAYSEYSSTVVCGPWAVECKKCLACGPEGKSKNEAIELWNRWAKND